MKRLKWKPNHCGICFFMAFALLSYFSSSLGADDKKDDKKKPDPKDKKSSEGEGGGGFSELGTLGKRLKDTDFYELTLSKKDGGKTVKKTVLVEIPEGTAVAQERVGRIQDLKEGDKLQLFAKPEERDVPGKGGIAGGTEYLIKRTQIVVAGSEIKINKNYQDPKEKGFKWCEVEVEKSVGSMRVKFEGQSYLLTLDKKTPIIIADKVENHTKALKSGLKVAIRGSPTEKPDTEDKKGPEEAYKATSILIVQPNLASYHDTLLSI